MSATWMHLLEQIEPDYFKLKQMAEDGPVISIALEKRRVRWWICIHEDWGNTPKDQQYQYYTATDNNVDQRILWAEEQLNNWKYVSRQSWQHWAFLRKHDAEKFITLFNIKWS
jgi:hypothetical protein